MKFEGHTREFENGFKYLREYFFVYIGWFERNRKCQVSKHCFKINFIDISHLMATYVASFAFCCNNIDLNKQSYSNMIFHDSISIKYILLIFAKHILSSIFEASFTFYDGHHITLLQGLLINIIASYLLKSQWVAIFEEISSFLFTFQTLNTLIRLEL